MSYSGSEDDPFCDICNGMYVTGTYAPWPAERLQGAESNGRVADRDEFLICPACTRKAIIAYATGEARRLAIRSSNYWGVREQERQETDRMEREETHRRLLTDPGEQEHLVLLHAQKEINEAAYRIKAESTTTEDQ